MSFFRRNHHLLISFLFLAVLIWSSLQYANFKKGQWEKDVRNQTLEILISKKSSLEKALYSRIYYTRGVAAFVSLKPDITNNEFAQLAGNFIKNDPVIGTMSLSRNCIINAIYPLSGHEAALGLDLLAHPKRKEIVDKTIETRQTFVAGPVELVEGGIAFISYTPIFDTTKDSLGVFWGLTDIVIRKDELFREAGLNLNEKNFNFALQGYDGKGFDGAIFWGDSTIFKTNPVTINIELPYGRWILAAIPNSGWGFYYDQDVVLTYVLITSSFIIAILFFILLKAFTRIRRDAREFKAIFGSLDTLIIEFNEHGEYLKIAPTNIDLLVLPQNEILGKKVTEVFEPELAELFLNSIQKCLHTKDVVIIEYPLEVRGKSMWFVARISYKTEKTVIYNAYDVTKIKKAENELKESKERLVKLNDLKDRFFSILAHDLRNPVASFFSITELVLDKSFVQTPEEKERLIKSLHDTASGLNNLLDNLFSWSQAQQNNIQLNLASYQVQQICENIVKSQLTHSLIKKVNILNQIDTDHYAILDTDLTGIIFRNLISNAIKFSNSNTEIVITSELNLIEGKEFLLIKVKDQGCGIPEEKIADIFERNNNYKTQGTNKEKGSGLGLILCREFVEMQGGKIWVKSQLGEGSTFTFSLPV